METVEFVRSAAEARNLHLDEEVLQAVAERSSDSDEIDGALVRLQMLGRLTGRKYDLSLWRDAIASTQ